MNTPLARTPLYDRHAARGGRMVEFAGWSMPVQYSSIVEEHQATRTAVGLFDISHMGRLRFDGPQAAGLVDSLVTRNVARLQPGRIRYALVTNDRGGVKDDVLVYHLQDAAGGSYHLMVVNASNRDKVLAWIAEHSDGSTQVTDLTRDWAMIAVQGPKALQILQPLVEADLAAMKYYTGAETRIAGHSGIVSRTGYTGEDGCELIVGSAAAPALWDALVDAAAGRGGGPAGLGARDTLRLEAAMPLYGHELNEDITPLQAGLGFAVDLEKAPYPGRDALRQLDQQSLPALVGLQLAGRRAAREGYAIGKNGETVGRVTSGSFSPTLQKAVAMGYVARDYSQPGTPLEIDIRGGREAAVVVPLPFYRRPQS